MVNVSSICLRLVLSLLTTIQYLQIEPSKKGIHNNENMMLKCFICTDSSYEQSAFDGLKKNNYFLVY